MPNKHPRYPQRTKIITTLGPPTSTPEKILALYEAGMTTVRLNFSHGSHEEHLGRMEATKKVRNELGQPISIMLDTKGPEIRVGKMKNGEQEITRNQDVVIYTTEKEYFTRECANNELTVSFDIEPDMKSGDVVLIDDGKLTLVVKAIKSGQVICTAKNNYVVKTNKRVNLPGVDVSLPFLSPKDKGDIEFGIDQGIDYIAASFVNTADNIKEIRKILAHHDAKHIQIIAKIESVVGIKNIDAIIEAADGIMLARGDLGLEIPYQDVPYWEKVIIRKCRERGKIVIVATQMLDSMMVNPHPTRAEVTDVYYATELGADATMLSGETASGDFPTLAVETMSTINKRAEQEFYGKLYYEHQLAIIKETMPDSEEKSIAIALTDMAKDGKYQYAVVLSRTGKLLKACSRFRPNINLVGICEAPLMYTAFGVWSSISMHPNSAYDLVSTNTEAALDVAKAWGAKAGDKVLVLKHNRIETLTI